jgi:polysaccharide biosynthesis/export protein
MKNVGRIAVCAVLITVIFCVSDAGAQSHVDEQAAGHGNGNNTGVPLPAGYTIGPEDVLSIVFWRDKEMSADVVVRPDGKVSLPLLNDVDAAGHTPDQLREQLEKSAARFVADPNATVIVKEINSRKVFITGNVGKPGMYPLSGELTVLQFIAAAGGLLEYADTKNIGILREVEGREQRLTFNYRDVSRGRNVQQNIQLKPGDTVVVP